MSDELAEVRLNHLHFVLKGAARRWRRKMTGSGGACCQIQEVNEARRQAYVECAKELESLIANKTPEKVVVTKKKTRPAASE